MDKYFYANGYDLVMKTDENYKLTLEAYRFDQFLEEPYSNVVYQADLNNTLQN